MARVLFALLIVVLVVLWMRHIRRQPSAQQKKLYLQSAVGAVAVLLLLGALSGRLHWLGAVAAAAMPFFLRLFPLFLRLAPLLQFWQRRRGANVSGGNTSTVATALLQMQLDHDSGEMRGSVLEGPFKGSLLNDLQRSQLLELLRYCAEQDRESQQLLTAYLQRRFGPEFFEQAGYTEHQDSAPGASGSTMTVAEARQILGVGEQAGRDDIVKAHRKLMQKLHPDRGGSDYLAAKVNEAKDILMGVE